ncbi:phosphate/phosphite/phosphonate ABC transporter substrate-binding protein [Brevundimonas naejangsanensis]|uniref:Phosphate/phosphite/phosphonate ABC transporter substrate-binding protein n=1 Tax=Brevundimonas naejangsanensis TaxID=588932 RepID=A0A494RDD5_9CAUL|nr:phosphate/phosphite/phosphonate ABC transporter substrate-binding protein [Brevundimonas naejangsanensis]AYG94295.1 phosphate/phosphite/phosphonate ABC transporter substrate-binding protein [Brevundimonas naejangsanensis]
MTHSKLSRRALGLAAAAVLALGLAACGSGDKTTPAGGGAPTQINFAILPAEGQASSGPLWQPLLDDMTKAVGVPVKPYFASNYTVLVEAMRGNQIQAAWFPAKTAIEAIDRANGEVVARIVDPNGLDSYQSTLIVKKGSGITLQDVLACGKKYDFGIGDALSTSGTLAPMTFLFNPNHVVPNECFKTVRTANHQANSFAVANGLVQVATSNTINTVFIGRSNPQIAAQLEEIWRSPPIPEAGIVIRQDLDPAIKEKIRGFFLSYGRGEGAEAERQRKILQDLNYSGFNPADESYLNPVREMIADQALAEAKDKGDTAGAARAEAELQRLRRLREVQP